MNRRKFLKTAIFTCVLTTTSNNIAKGTQFLSDTLNVWSCGGLSEAMIHINKKFERKTGVKISYTGAFAAALGKSLLGNAKTEIFCGRVLKLAKDLKKAGKMLYFKPLCFTEYVIVTPRGNPKEIKEIQELGKSGVPVILPLGASPPGGDAVRVIIKKANIEQAVMKNLIEKETCVIKMMHKIIKGKAAASIVERRLTRIPEFEGKVDVIPIDEKYFPPGPLTFTVGVMKYAKDMALANDYVEFIRSDEAQSIFERQGFIPAISEKGKILIEKWW